MAIRTANFQSFRFVENRRDFQASNLHGETRNGIYIVFSYKWYPLYIHKNGRWYENIDKYSMTTSKQKTKSRPRHIHRHIQFIELTYDEMKKLY